MKAFSFRLERVLNLAGQREKLWKKAVADAQAEQERRYRLWEEAVAQEGEAAREAAAARAGEVDVAMAIQATRYLAKARERSLAELSDWQKARRIEQEQREHLIQAARGRRTLEKLEARRYRVWVKAANREQDRNLDELLHQVRRHPLGEARG